jgi:hypothetical protein
MVYIPVGDVIPFLRVMIRKQCGPVCLRSVWAPCIYLIYISTNCIKYTFVLLKDFS